MGLGLVPVQDGAWDKVRRNFARINSILLGPATSPTWAGLTLTGLTANSLIYTPATKVLTSLGAATNGQVPIGSTGAAPVLATITGTADEIDVAVGAGTITIGIVNPLIVGKGGTGVATLTDHGILLGSGTGAVTPLGAATNGQLPIGSTGADPVLAGITGTANQVVSTPGAGTITLSLPQDIHTGATPQFAGGTFTGVVTGVTPTAGTHLATKEYVDLALGASKDFFLSDTASGIGALNYAYPHETGEASSTIITAGLGLGDAQLVKGFITEAGQPATTTIHEGIIDFHLHAKKGASNQRITTLYAIISRVDADGTSNKTTVATSEATEALEATEIVYDIHATLADDIEIAATARLILDVYANVGTGAQDSVVTVYMEGADDSYFSTKVDGGIWQNHGDVLDGLNTVGIVTDDNYMLVGTAAGVFAWETGATLRASIGVDAAGVAAGLVSGHESTYNHANYNTAYSHSQLTSGNPHSVTPTELSLVIGTNVQAYDAGLSSLAGLTYASASFLKCTAENTYAVRTIAETKSDLSLNLVENTALSTWVGANTIVTVGTIATGVWSGTDVAIADGGTGQGTAQLAINALTAVAAGTNEHVLTKDTDTGNAIWKAATGGADAFTVKVDAAATAGYIGAASNDGVLRTSTGITKTDGGDFITLTTNDSQIAHDSLSGYSANKHIDHTAVTLTAGVGLSGGGDISANRTFALDIGELTEITTIDAAADYVAVLDATDSTHKKILPTNLGHRFVNRGDPAAVDWHETGSKAVLNTDGTWRDLDVSSIVPAGALAILFSVTVKDNAADSLFALRKNGNVNTNITSKIRTQVANLEFNGLMMIACDTNRVVEYVGDNLAFTQISVSVMGWWV